MRILISGASGLIGSALTPLLSSRGHDVTALVRRPVSQPGEIEWDPVRGVLPPCAVETADAIINLAGASIGAKRLTASHKREVLASRVDATQTIARAIAQVGNGCVLIQGSAMGFYGDSGERLITESSPRGEGFLADVCVAWEEAALPARDAGSRVAFMRTGLVLAAHGGFAQRLLPLVRRGLFGGFGAGDAYQSWITLEDHARATLHVLESDLEGPINMVSPDPVTDANLVAALSAAFGRRPGPKVPAWALRLAIGEAVSDLLASQRGEPQALVDAGFTWNHPVIADAAHWVAHGTSRA